MGEQSSESTPPRGACTRSRERERDRAPVAFYVPRHRRQQNAGQGEASSATTSQQETPPYLSPAAAEKNGAEPRTLAETADGEQTEQRPSKAKKSKKKILVPKSSSPPTAPPATDEVTERVSSNAAAPAAAHPLAPAACTPDDGAMTISEDSDLLNSPPRAKLPERQSEERTPRKEKAAKAAYLPPHRRRPNPMSSTPPRAAEADDGLPRRMKDLAVSSPDQSTGPLASKSGKEKAEDSKVPAGQRKGEAKQSTQSGDNGSSGSKDREENLDLGSRWSWGINSEGQVKGRGQDGGTKRSAEETGAEAKATSSEDEEDEAVANITRMIGEARRQIALEDERKKQALLAQAAEQQATDLLAGSSRRPVIHSRRGINLDGIEEFCDPVTDDHILEIKGFPQGLQSFQLDMMLAPYRKAGCDIRWIEHGVTALAVFRSRSLAQSALAVKRSEFLQVRPLDEAGDAARSAVRAGVSPPRRPATNTSTASRLISRSLGIRTPQRPTQPLPRKQQTTADAWD